MRNHVTVIPEDNLIIVDGLALRFGFTAPENMHALQWRAGSGHVEYKDGAQNFAFWDTENYKIYVAPYVEYFEKEAARIEEAKQMPPSAEENKQLRLADIDAELARIDAATSRPARALLKSICNAGIGGGAENPDAGTAPASFAYAELDAYDKQKLLELEEKAAALRLERVKLVSE